MNYISLLRSQGLLVFLSPRSLIAILLPPFRSRSPIHCVSNHHHHHHHHGTAVEIADRRGSMGRCGPMQAMFKVSATAPDTVDSSTAEIQLRSGCRTWPPPPSLSVLQTAMSWSPTLRSQGFSLRSIRNLNSINSKQFRRYFTFCCSFAFTFDCKAIMVFRTTSLNRRHSIASSKPCWCSIACHSLSAS